MYTAEQIPQLQRVLFAGRPVHGGRDKPPAGALGGGGAVAEGLRAKSGTGAGAGTAAAPGGKRSGPRCRTLPAGGWRALQRGAQSGAGRADPGAAGDHSRLLLRGGGFGERLAAFVGGARAEPPARAGSLAIFLRRWRAGEEGVDVEAAVRVKRAGAGQGRVCVPAAGTGGNNGLRDGAVAPTKTSALPTMPSPYGWKSTANTRWRDPAARSATSGPAAGGPGTIF